TGSWPGTRESRCVSAASRCRWSRRSVLRGAVASLLPPLMSPRARLRMFSRRSRSDVISPLSTGSCRRTLTLRYVASSRMSSSSLCRSAARAPSRPRTWAISREAASTLASSRCTSSLVARVDCAPAAAAVATVNSTSRVVRPKRWARVIEASSRAAAIWLPPGHEPFDPTDAGEVIVDDGHHQHHEHHETCEQHLFLDADAEIASRDAFERHDEDVSAVEDGDRHQVEQSEVQAERCHQAEQSDPAELRRFARELRDGDRPHQLLRRCLASDQSPE